MRMQELRAREQRPTVALVLSGGGAKGAAEVGAMKYLEQIGIPIDIICGTSIGGLVGALYSLGYTPDQMQELFRSQDWMNTLTDSVDPEYLPYSQKMYNSQYGIHIPFSTRGEVLDWGMPDGPNYRNQSLLGSLPSGYAYGFNVSKLLSSLAIGYEDKMSFMDLPIPYICVAADLISCKAKNWGSGYLTTAMRSTMSIPGLFSPVRIDGMVLVDGGTRNNFPADIAKAIGADIIIGIELSDSQSAYTDINNVGDIAMQFIDMLGRDAYNKNIDIPDLIIKPNLQGYNMLSFNPEAIDTMIVRGYDAAVAKSDELLELKSRLGEYQTYATPAAKAINLAQRSVKIQSISFEGLSDEDSKIMFSLIGLERKDIISKASIDSLMNRLQASEYFSSVKYSLRGKEEPFDLVFHCVKAPAHHLGLGYRMDTEEWAALLIDLGINQHTLAGSKLNLSTKLGMNFSARLHYAYSLPLLPTINLDMSFASHSGIFNPIESLDYYNSSYWTHQESIYISDIRWTRYNFKLGFRNYFANIDKNSHLGTILTEKRSSEHMLKSNTLSAFIDGHYYSFDDYFFPSKGINLRFSTRYDFAQLRNYQYQPLLYIGIDYKQVFPLGEKWAIIPDLHLRNLIFTGTQTASILQFNTIGGFIPARNHQTQVPFFGLSNTLIVDNFLVSAALDLRYRPFEKLFCSLQTGIVETGPQIASLVSDFIPAVYAFGLELGYDSFLGPCKLNAHYNNLQGLGLYFSFGYEF